VPGKVPGARALKHRFDLDGGTVALDFVNTVGGMRGTAPEEHLSDFGDLVYWAEQAGLLDKRAKAKLPEHAPRAYAEAIRLREALNDVVVASLEGHPPPASALAAVNQWIADALSIRKLHPKGRAFEARFDDDGAPLAFLRPVALDALELLEREMAEGRVRRCGEAEVGRCSWLFLDETKNGNRRFCSMTSCGNRAKQRRFQERTRKAHR
jgi:predicted RNA-binding Zn ribbon-like protein